MSGTLLVSENYQASYGCTTYAVKLKLEQISRDGGTQSRVAINHFVVEEYAELFREGITFPPVTIYYDGEFYWLADGFHRVQAAAVAGIESIAADIRQVLTVKLSYIQLGQMLVMGYGALMQINTEL